MIIETKSRVKVFVFKTHPVMQTVFDIGRGFSFSLVIGFGSEKGNITGASTAPGI